MSIQDGDKLLVRVTETIDWEDTFNEEFYQWSIDTDQFEGTRQKFVEHIMQMGRNEKCLKSFTKAKLIKKL